MRVEDTKVGRHALALIQRTEFVVSLPWAATSKSIRRSAHALVFRPAQATFTRPLGDLDSLPEY